MTRMTAPARRYAIRITVTMTVYVVSLLAATYLIERAGVAGPLAWGLALLPGLAIAGMFYSVGMFMLEQKDEFIRMLLVRQNLIATAFAMSVVVTWGFLEGFELVGHHPGYYIVVLWAFGLLLGAVSNRITYGSWGSCW